MKDVLTDIQEGRFTRDWMLENRVNQTELQGDARQVRRRTPSRRSAASCAP